MIKTKKGRKVKRKETVKGLYVFKGAHLFGDMWIMDKQGIKGTIGPFIIK